LRNHFYTHSSEKLFKCKDISCEKKYKSYTSLNKHFKTKHNTELFDSNVDETRTSHCEYQMEDQIQIPSIAQMSQVPDDSLLNTSLQASLLFEEPQIDLSTNTIDNFAPEFNNTCTQPCCLLMNSLDTLDI
jgi:hypothetical protein